MTTHCRECYRIQRVVALIEVTKRREGVCTRAYLDCGHHAHFVTTAQQIDDFRATKKLISEVRIDP